LVAAFKDSAGRVAPDIAKHQITPCATLVITAVRAVDPAQTASSSSVSSSISSAVPHGDPGSDRNRRGLLISIIAVSLLGSYFIGQAVR